MRSFNFFFHSSLKSKYQTVNIYQKFSLETIAALPKIVIIQLKYRYSIECLIGFGLYYQLYTIFQEFSRNGVEKSAQIVLSIPNGKSIRSFKVSFFFFKLFLVVFFHYIYSVFILFSKL